MVEGAAKTGGSSQFSLRWAVALESMENKEETSFLPVKDARVKERRHSMQRPFRFLHITAMVVMFCWLVFLTLSPHQQQQSTMSADMIRQLKKNQDVSSKKPQLNSDTDLFSPRHVREGK